MQQTAELCEVYGLGVRDSDQLGKEEVGNREF